MRTPTERGELRNKNVWWGGGKFSKEKSICFAADRLDYQILFKKIIIYCATMWTMDSRSQSTQGTHHISPPRVGERPT